MLLVDRWAEIVATHTLIEEQEHDAWPKVICWVYYKPRCSCGEVHPRHSQTTHESRPDIPVRIQYDHLRHLVSVLLDDQAEDHDQAEDEAGAAP